MPCDDGRPYYYYSSSSDTVSMREAQRRNDKLARMLCFIVETAPKAIIADLLNGTAPQAKELRKWYEEHQKLDAKRREDDKRIAEIKRKRLIEDAKEAIAKLAPEQRRELGLP